MSGEMTMCVVLLPRSVTSSILPEGFVEASSDPRDARRFAGEGAPGRP